MWNIYVLLLMTGTAILATNGCLLGDTHMCHSGHPLILGGRLQPLTREGEFLDPCWNNQDREFVFLRPPGSELRRGGLLGKRGVIRIGERRTCSGGGDVQCPIPSSDVPCEMVLSNISASEPTGPPKNITPLDATRNSVTMKWNEVECSQRNGGVEKYAYILEKNGDFNLEGTTTNTEVALSQLDCGTTYSFKVRARNSASYGPFAGYGPFSEGRLFRTTNC